MIFILKGTVYARYADATERIITSFISFFLLIFSRIDSVDFFGVVYEGSDNLFILRKANERKS